MQSVSAGGGDEDRMTAGKIEGNESTVRVKLSYRRDGRRYEIDMRHDGMGGGRLETLAPIQELNQPFHHHNSVNLSLRLVMEACFLCPHFTGGGAGDGHLEDRGQEQTRANTAMLIFQCLVWAQSK